MLGLVYLAIYGALWGVAVIDASTRSGPLLGAEFLIPALLLTLWFRSLSRELFHEYFDERPKLGAVVPLALCLTATAAGLLAGSLVGGHFVPRTTSSFTPLLAAGLALVAGIAAAWWERILAADPTQRLRRERGHDGLDLGRKPKFYVGRLEKKVLLTCQGLGDTFEVGDEVVFASCRCPVCHLDCVQRGFRDPYEANQLRAPPKCETHGIEGTVEDLGPMMSLTGS